MDELMVDGNALAGPLREVFVHEMTESRVSCRGCGKVEPIGAEHAYVQAPGYVLRCRHCSEVLLVMTRRQHRYVLAFPGCRWMEVPAGP